MAQLLEQMRTHWSGLLVQLPWAEDAQAWAQAWQAQPQTFADLQAQYAAQYLALWQDLGSRKKTSAEVDSLESKDKRFRDPQWQRDPYYAYLHHAYQLGAQHLEALVNAADLPEPTRARLRFAVSQWIHATSPSNFAATNPEVLRAARESSGESLTRGLTNLLSDLAHRRITQTDAQAFTLGQNLATTPGAVVFENALMQLIQYTPTTAQVGRQPLVMVPPCINKFYILDLQPENSLVRYVVEAGHTVFVVSWKNPKESESHLHWDHYLEEGVIRALHVARDITRARQVNALGFCVGGTMLAAALAVMAARQASMVASATYLTTLLDFSDSGQLGCLIDEQSVRLREQQLGAGGLLPGSDLAMVFSALRANDLVWPYVVNNYLKGETPPAFDLLYWNADSTNLPGPMYCWYVRNMYLENRLRLPGGVTNCGVPVDLSRVGLPSFIFAAHDDHIVPWKSAYASVQLLGHAQTQFVLGAAGHVAGVINPAAKAKRHYWVSPRYPASADAWLNQATQHAGSWWPVWMEWLAQFKGGERAAPKTLGNKAHPVIEPAPGRYVKESWQ